jgi:4'-phosphopantetheinyl transferase
MGCGTASEMIITIEVWYVHLATTEGQLARLARCLAPDEIVTAGRFKFEQHRRRFMMARASLRHILARYIGEFSDVVRFDFGPHGKPHLANERHAAKITFNLSHSEDWALIAVAPGLPVGIDIEHVRPELATDDTIRLVFSTKEQAALAAFSGVRRVQAFFKGWTSKEAYIKGLGDGLLIPLQEFEVSVDPGNPAELLRPYRAAKEWPWSLHDLKMPPGYIATLAVARRPMQIVTRLWTSG